MHPFVPKVCIDLHVVLMSINVAILHELVKVAMNRRRGLELRICYNLHFWVNIIDFCIFDPSVLILVSYISLPRKKTGQLCLNFLCRKKVILADGRRWMMLFQLLAIMKMKIMTI